MNPTFVITKVDSEKENENENEKVNVGCCRSCCSVWS